MAKDKARYFTFLLYPESIPEDWIEKLELLGVPIAISPLHDKDLSDVKGQKYKKAHYHVIYVAKNPVTVDSVRKRIQRAISYKRISIVQIVTHSIENINLYLSFESKNVIVKNKHVYDKVDIILLNNIDVVRYITFDVEDNDDLLNQVCDMVVEHDL